MVNCYKKVFVLLFIIGALSGTNNLIDDYLVGEAGATTFLDEVHNLTPTAIHFNDYTTYSPAVGGTVGENGNIYLPRMNGTITELDRDTFAVINVINTGKTQLSSLKYLGNGEYMGTDGIDLFKGKIDGNTFNQTYNISLLWLPDNMTDADAAYIVAGELPWDVYIGTPSGLFAYNMDTGEHTELLNGAIDSLNFLAFKNGELGLQVDGNKYGTLNPDGENLSPFVNANYGNFGDILAFIHDDGRSLSVQSIATQELPMTDYANDLKTPVVPEPSAILLGIAGFGWLLYQKKKD